MERSSKRARICQNKEHIIHIRDKPIGISGQTHVGVMSSRDNIGYVDEIELPHSSVNCYRQLLLITSDSCDNPFQVNCMYNLDEAQIQVIGYDIIANDELFNEQMEEHLTVKFELELIQIIRLNMSHCMGFGGDSACAPTAPIDRCISPLQIAGWNNNYPLMRHQVDAHRWLIYCENRILNSAVITARTTSVPILNWNYDRLKDMLSCHPGTPQTIAYQGGILASNTGSGKTAVILSLIANERSSFSRDNRRCMAEAHIPTGATLIIVPQNLITQWVNEITKFYDQRTRKPIIIISNVDDFSIYTIEDIANACIVLTTTNFLISRPYNDAVFRQVKHIVKDQNTFRVLNRPCVIRTATRIAKCSSPPKFPFDNQIPLHSFWWRRVVIDEIQELFRSSSSQFARFDASCTWGMSGTPELHDGHMLSQLCTLVGCDTPHFWTPEFCSQVVTTCVYCNRTIDYGPLEKHIHRVNLTSMESQLIDSCDRSDTESVVKTCCYFNIDQVRGGHSFAMRGLSDITAVVINQRRLSLAGLHREKLQHNRNIETINLRIDDDVARHARISHLVEIERNDGREHEAQLYESELEVVDIQRTSNEKLRQKFEDHLHRVYASIESIERGLAYFERQASVYEPTQCPICMSNQTTVITSCGHQYCRPCTGALFGGGKHITCPMCKEHLLPRDIHDVVGRAADDVERYGSKISSLLELLDKIVTHDGDQVLIFAQWPPLVNAIRAILSERSFKVGAVMNNMSTRESAIQKFVSGDTRILILVTEASSSGLNLVQANHVIFMNALVGSDSQTRIMEEQAIHRAYRMNQTRPVHVHWFIARDTPEEKLFDNWCVQEQ